MVLPLGCSVLAPGFWLRTVPKMPPMKRSTLTSKPAVLRICGRLGLLLALHVGHLDQDGTLGDDELDRVALEQGAAGRRLGDDVALGDLVAVGLLGRVDLRPALDSASTASVAGLLVKSVTGMGCLPFDTTMLTLVPRLSGAPTLGSTPTTRPAATFSSKASLVVPSVSLVP